ncbi:hypothetical protein V5799_008995 [Amblyomma americanum]|uniref:Uncharacterized protein n=1 Tax=Amblyomma americanum TaxID=6943 RepID=A0AAQ4FBW1_AMBAM
MGAQGGKKLSRRPQTGPNGATRARGRTAEESTPPLGPAESQPTPQPAGPQAAPGRTPPSRNQSTTRVSRRHPKSSPSSSSRGGHSSSSVRITVPHPPPALPVIRNCVRRKCAGSAFGAIRSSDVLVSKARRFPYSAEKTGRPFLSSWSRKRKINAQGHAHHGHHWRLRCRYSREGAS